MMYWHDILIALTAFVSEFLGTISGFGSSTFFVPIGLLFEKYNFILALTALLHIFGNISKLFLFRNYFDRALFLKLVVPSVVLTGLGALLNKYVSFDILKVFLGFFLIILAIIFFFKLKATQIMFFKNARMTLGISGFITGLLGTGGALRGIALTSLQIEKNSFVILSASIDLGGDLLRASIYLYNNYFDWSHLFYIPTLMALAYSGSFLGKFVLTKIKQ
ncbi:MAG: sulfite exporter TauE/SafE family protein, partial [Bdellovibrionota bacterium]